MIPHAAVGNPPYNDESSARVPIYPTILKNYSQEIPDFTFQVIPANWFSQPDSTVGKSVRSSLKKLGLYKIKLNPYETFTTAKVKTCTVFCRKGYQGSILLEDLDTGKSTNIKDFDDQILYTADIAELDLLYRLRPYQQWTTHEGSKKDQTKWRIATSYRKENFDQVPLNPLKVLKPYYESESGYRVFASFHTEQDALNALPKYQSFWSSDLIVWILKKTRTSTTLDNPQLAWVPKIIIDKVFSNDDINQMFNLSQSDLGVLYGSK